MLKVGDRVRINVKRLNSPWLFGLVGTITDAHSGGYFVVPDGYHGPGKEIWFHHDELLRLPLPKETK